MTPQKHLLPYLRAFEAVARLQSVRLAGEELGLTSGAVSLQLKKLASGLGVVLFEKDGRGLRLTPAGQNLAEVVARTLGEIQAAATAATQVSVRNVRRLTVALPPAIGAAWLAGALIDFRNQHGIDDLRIRQCIRAEEVDWGITDFAVVFDRPPWPGLWWQLLTEVPLRPVCAPSLFQRIMARRREPRLDDFTLLHEDDGSAWRRWCNVAGAESKSVTHVYFTGVILAVAAATEGYGLALVSEAVIWPHLSDGRLIQPFATSMPATQAYYLVCQESRATDPALAQLTDWLVRHVQEKKAALLVR